MDPRSYAGRRSPPTINTSNAGAMPQTGDPRRFSYTETPIDSRQLPFGRTQNYRPNQETLQEAESPLVAGAVEGYHIQSSSSPLSASYASPQTANINTIAHQPSPAQTTSSPYGVPEPDRPHPAYSIPVSSQGMQVDMTPPQQPSQSTHHMAAPYPPQYSQPDARRASTIPMNAEPDAHRLSTQPPVKRSSVHPDHVQIPYSPHSLSSPSQPIFAPDAATGPNGMAPEMHQPGQVTHPNMHNVSGPTSVKDPFLHSLCECNADVGTCLTGLFCPCILDSKTAYRMSRKSQKKDPTDMLGFSSCNNRCGFMGVFGVCGLFCIFPLTLRTRIRHTYKLQGSFAHDLIEACCCCCCVAIQNEREVRDREDRIRQNAGPAAQYRSDTINMSYTPGGM